MSVFDQDLNKIAQFADMKFSFGVKEISRMDIHQLLNKHVEVYSAWLKDVVEEDGYRRVGNQIMFSSEKIAQLS